MAFELHIVFDCADPDRGARFWLTALDGYAFAGSDPDRGPDSPATGGRGWASRRPAIRSSGPSWAAECRLRRAPQQVARP
ncbi:VOC family protein [Streptomyces montanus]|uniref:VOC family protein n=1 Tax=Streptomyces montanus TaxID=2580423 RepID=UPI003CCC6816